MFGECKGKPDPHKIIEKVCPKCGSIIEMFPVDAKMTCEKCGFVAYNDTMSCVRWCSSARSCVGEEMYAAVQEAIKREAELAAHDKSDDSKNG